MATGSRDRDAREARERSKMYRARQEFHEGLQRRSRRDNVLAGVIGGAVVLAAIGVQTAYFTAGPGVPEPSSSVTESPAPDPTAPESPAPTGSGAPDPAASTPAPSVAP